jgi:hypothetical protein
MTPGLPMTRDTAYELANQLVDAGFSTTIAIGVHPKHLPRESCTVQCQSLGFDADELEQLLTIARRNGLRIHLINGSPTFVGEPTDAEKRRRAR